MNFHCTKINWKKSVPHFVETLCTRPSGRLGGLALIFGRPSAFLPPFTRPSRAPGPASVSDVVKQGLTLWWRVLPKQWPTGAASRGCRGRRRGETRGWGPVWERERKTPMRTGCVIISKPQLLGFISCAFVSKRCYFTRLQGNALFCVCTWVCLCSFLYECLFAAHLWSFRSPVRPDQAVRRSKGTVRLTRLTFTHKLRRPSGTHTFKFCAQKWGVF